MTNKEIHFENNFDLALFLRKLTKGFDVSEYQMLSWDVKEWKEWLSSEPTFPKDVDWSTFKLWFKRRELIGNRPDLSTLFFNYNNYCQSDVHDFNFNGCTIKFFLKRQNSNDFLVAKTIFDNIYNNYNHSIWGVKPTHDYIEQKIIKTKDVLDGYRKLYDILFKIEFDKDIIRKKLNSIEDMIKRLENRMEFLYMARTCE